MIIYNFDSLLFDVVAAVAIVVVVQSVVVVVVVRPFVVVAVNIAAAVADSLFVVDLAGNSLLKIISKRPVKVNTIENNSINDEMNNYRNSRSGPDTIK
jgi:hypothetical protein